MVDQRCWERAQPRRGMDGGATDGVAEPSGPTRNIRAPAVTLWGGMLLTVCVLAVFFLTVWRRRVRLAELGTVSAQWLSEHREYDRNYPNR